MSESPLKPLLEQSLADARLSRGERQSLRAELDKLAPDPARLALVRTEAFALAAAALPPEAGPVVEWLRGVVEVLSPRAPGGPAAGAGLSEAHFSPGEDCPRRIARLFQDARRTADVCVFTITDDRVSDAIFAAHRRGVAVRVITDNEKEHDLGSDVPRLREAGVPVRVDRTPFHMHHKFAVFDGVALLNGSYNWTRGAARDNQENLTVTGDPRLVGAFAAAFERLWKELE